MTPDLRLDTYLDSRDMTAPPPILTHDRAAGLFAMPFICPYCRAIDRFHLDGPWDRTLIVCNCCCGTTPIKGVEKVVGPMRISYGP